MNEPQTPQSARSLPQRLRNVRAGTRRDLDISRHVFRRRVLYIVRDPVTFQSHSLSVPDYEIFVRLRDTHTLGEILQALVRDGTLSADREDDFYHFVLQLHQLGFLMLPVTDAQALYKRHLRRRKLQRWRLPFNILFFRIPLLNPDAFLHRTVHLARPLFSRWFVALWLCLAALSLALVAQRWPAITDPPDGLLAIRNLPLIWASLILLKVVHEFGHAYACKHLGGCVPEMGAFLILFTPCAYVDASDSWRFPARRDRLIVCLGGMYVESIFAMLALLLWSMTRPSSALNVFAYQTMLLASITTIAFNANPLMRFDGYYILSDLLGIPNLRKRSGEYLLALLKRTALGIRTRAVERGRSLKLTLLAYGISAAIYKVLLMVGISALIAIRLPLLGWSMAALFLGALALSLTLRAARYLLFAPETSPVRTRAVLVSVVTFLLVPAGILLVPVPGNVVAAGVLEHDAQHTLYAPAAGFVRAVHAEPGDRVCAGEPIVDLDDQIKRSALAQRRAEFDAAVLRLRAARAESQADAARQRQRLAFHAEALDTQRLEIERLSIRSEQAGALVEGLRDRDTGRYIRQGDEVAVIATGRPLIRALLTEQDLDAADTLDNRSVECRSVAEPHTVLRGHVLRVSPIGSRAVEHESLTHLAGGRIAVDADTKAAESPYFELVIRLEGQVSLHRTGATYLVRLPAAPRPFGDGIRRRLLRFYHRVRTGT